MIHLTKIVNVDVSGTLHVRISHYGSYEIEVTEDMTREDIEEAAKEKLQEDYYQHIAPLLGTIDSAPGVSECEVRDHEEDVDIEAGFDDDEEDED